MGGKRLSDELEKYGYVFSMKKTGLIYVIAFAGFLIVGRLFCLHIISQIILCAIGLFFLPFFLRNTYRNSYQQKRFSDVNIYMEQFLYSFQKSGKILVSLDDVASLFHEGTMYQRIEEARDYIMHTYDEASVEEEGLKIIENEYGNYYLKVMHKFTLQAEALGGDYADSVKILLEARRLWADRVYDLQQMRRKKRLDILLSIFVSLLICLMIYMMSWKLELHIEDTAAAQIVTVLVLGLDFLIFYRADAQLTAGFIEDEPEEEKYVEYYEKLCEEAKTPYRKLDHYFLKKYVTREIEKMFPRWLMELSLLLQTENVQVAIYKSYDDAPLILKPMLKELSEELSQNPDQIEPFLHFLEDYSLPEVHSAMKMLYSISEGRGGNSKNQITEILSRNQKLMDRAEKMRQEDSLAGMHGLFLAPQLTAGFKLAVDMVLLLVVFMSSVSELVF